MDLVYGWTDAEAVADGSGSCGDALHTVNRCVTYACGACSTSLDITACDQDISSGAKACATYATRADPSGICAPIKGIDASPVCFPTQNTGFVAFANVFCGSGP